MKKFEVTFEWPSGDWTWIFIEVSDYHEAILTALVRAADQCRVHNVRYLS